MRIVITGGSGFIGTNTVQAFLDRGEDEILNLDGAPPLDPAHNPLWKNVDILDAGAVLEAFRGFAPDAVIHLAARAECDENTTVEEGYRANTDGTRHVLEAIKATTSVKRVIITSSQFVCGPGYQPKDDFDYAPVTVYGQSKVVTEQLTRAANLACTWTIIRPTNIWGPWHARYRREFWRVVAKGLYLHPGGQPVVRCYGYVGNIIHQMQQILLKPAQEVHGQVFYVGERPGDIHGWVNSFSVALRGAPVRPTPRWILAGLGLAGDVVSAVTGKPFLITSSRVRSMTSDYVVDMEKTFQVLGESPYTLEQGVEKTVEWLKTHPL